jgi:hypothetical protein
MSGERFFEETPRMFRKKRESVDTSLCFRKSTRAVHIIRILLGKDEFEVSNLLFNWFD